MTSTALIRRAGGLVAAAVLLGSGLAACGDDDPGTAGERDSTPPASPTESESPSEPAGTEGPACEDVWVAGQDLPRDYDGCQDGDRWVEAMTYPCSSGQQLVTFRRNFYAAKGEVVNESPTPLAQDAEFQQALDACGA